MNKHELSPRNFLARGAVNQRLEKLDGENSRKLFGTSNKVANATVREMVFQSDLPVQIFNRSLAHIVEGRATVEDVDYVRRHQQHFPVPDGIDVVSRINQIKDSLYS